MQKAIKNEKFANAFSKLGEGEMPHEIISTIEQYVCSIYGFKCDRYINEVIKKMLEERSKPKPAERPLDCISIVQNQYIQTSFHHVELFLSDISNGHGLLLSYPKLHFWRTQYPRTFHEIMGGESQNATII